jgi:hypothetical protein
MARMEPAIQNYDAHGVDQITARPRKLSQADLAKLEAHERQGRRRRTVLERINALRTEPPWTGYDDMEVEDVNAALKERDGDTAGRVIDYERNHKARKTIIDFARRRQADSGPLKRGSRPKGPSGPQRRRRSTAQSAKSKSTSRAEPRTRGRSQAKAQPRSSTKSRRGRSQSGRRRARPPARAGVRQQLAHALRSTGARTGKVASEATQAVGTAAKQGRHAVGGAASDAGHTVGAAAKKAKGPALATGVVAAAIGGVALGRGSKVVLRRRKRLLGVPIPRRTTFGKTARQMSHAVDSAGSAGRQVSELSDAFRELRRVLADTLPADGKSRAVRGASGGVAKRALK